MRRQCTAVALRRFALASRRLVSWRLTHNCPGSAERLFDFFQPELQLIRIELVRMRPVSAAHQLLDDQLQLLDLGIGRVALRPERIALRAQPPYCAVLRFQHRYQGSQPSLELDRILPGLGGVEKHALIILAVIAQTQNLSDQPANNGAITGFGRTRDQSNPSSNRLSCAALKRIAPSCTGGQTKRPFSRRLWNRQSGRIEARTGLRVMRQREEQRSEFDRAH